jgi:molybdate transport system permease protein
VSGGGAAEAPAGIRPLAVLATLFLVLPLVALALRAPWWEAAGLLRQPFVLDAMRLSALTSLGALTIAAVFGIPLAWVLARRSFRGRDLLHAIAVLPMVLPPVVGGVALLLAYGRRGVVGAPVAEVMGVSLPFTTLGVVVAQAFVAMPFLLVPVESGLRALDPRTEEAAATLGASRWFVLRRVTLPMIAPSIAAGAALAWARALGEFGATITFAGNMPGRTQTMPLAVYLLLESDPEAAYLLSLILLALTVTVIVLLRGHLLARM